MSIVKEEIELTEDIKTELNELCKQYYEYVQEFQAAETNKKVYNGMIRDILKENNISKYVSEDGIKVSVTTSNKPSFCEEQLIPFLKGAGLERVIKTKEYVDMELLEDAIYHNDIDAQLLTPFKEDHFVTRLNCTKPKILKEST